jgi:hypothetical protein
VDTSPPDVGVEAGPAGRAARLVELAGSAVLCEFATHQFNPKK